MYGGEFFGVDLTRAGISSGAIEGTSESARRLYVFHPRRERRVRTTGVGEIARVVARTMEKERFQWQANSTKRAANGLSL